ncbi:MAG: TRAP transporter small permease subunit [Gammaproteobacteria bacterium]|nr:TRAP transporter small permease subunit [Gammaproteobacteria bacterium]
MLPDTAFSRVIDPWLIRIGKWTSVLWVILLIVIVSNVLLRYAFDMGRIEFEEIQWHLYSMGFLLGMSSAYQADAHIRVDVLHERFSPSLQAWLELYGIVLFLIPFTLVVLIFSVPFVIASFELGEISQAPGGLPFRWAIKAVLPIGFFLLLLAACSRLTRVWAFLSVGDRDGA